MIKYKTYVNQKFKNGYLAGNGRFNVNTLSAILILRVTFYSRCVGHRRSIVFIIYEIYFITFITTKVTTLLSRARGNVQYIQMVWMENPIYDYKIIIIKKKK